MRQVCLCEVVNAVEGVLMTADAGGVWFMD